MWKANRTFAYKVGHLKKAPDQALVLHQRATLLGLEKKLSSDLRSIMASLATTPTSLGEVEFGTKIPGGAVRHCVISGLSIRFAVYQHHRIVIVLAIAPVGKYLLAEP